MKSPSKKNTTAISISKHFKEILANYKSKYHFKNYDDTIEFYVRLRIKQATQK